MWLHAGILHYLANMNCVRQVGFMLEREYGWRKIGPLYLVGGFYGTSTIYISAKYLSLS